MLIRSHFQKRISQRFHQSLLSRVFLHPQGQGIMCLTHFLGLEQLELSAQNIKDRMLE